MEITDRRMHPCIVLGHADGIRLRASSGDLVDWARKPKEYERPIFTSRTCIWTHNLLFVAIQSHYTSPSDFTRNPSSVCFCLAWFWTYCWTASETHGNSRCGCGSLHIRKVTDMKWRLRWYGHLLQNLSGKQMLVVWQAAFAGHQ